MHAPDLTLIAPKPTLLDARTRLGTAHDAPDGWRVELDDTGETLPAVRAASCLVPPIAGDLVLVVAPTEQQAYILAVLTPREDATELAVDTELCVSAPAIRVQTKRARLVAGELTTVASRVASKFGRATIVGTAISMVADAFSQRSTSSVRTVAGLDRIVAGTIEQRAQGEVLVTANRAVVHGDELVKLDAAQLQLG